MPEVDKKILYVDLDNMQKHLETDAYKRLILSHHKNLDRVDSSSTIVRTTG